MLIASSVTVSDEVFVARITQRLTLELQILDDRLDHQIAVAQGAYIERAAQFPESFLALSRVDLALVTSPFQRARYSLQAFVEKLVRSLHDDRLESRPGTDFGDAGAHLSTAQNSDFPDSH